MTGTAAPPVTAPHVTVLLVSHNGRSWLDESLTSVLDQDYPSVDVLAVDNASTDGSRELLVERLGPDRVLVNEVDLGFGGAVAVGAASATAREADLLLILHDDCALEPGALTRLVERFEQDDVVAAVGPKLVGWEDPGRLQSVGWSIDAIGRPDSGLEVDERDHGQQDAALPTLYVSSSALLVERAAFEEVGGFDERYGLFRDDLDLCWRLWLTGRRVETAPSAVARHASGAADYDRPGAASSGARYLAERNTLATLLKNFGWPRLLLLLPAYLLLGIGRILGFLVSRRVGDAVETVRAWGWNLMALPGTLRRRRAVQSRRQRLDGELSVLFSRTAPRLREYAAQMRQRRRDRGDAGARLGRRATATLTVSAVALTVWLLAPLLPFGALRGGEFARWPADPGAFFGDYVRVWHDPGGLGLAATPSPAQALLGLVDLLTLSSSWLAPRLLLLGLPVLAGVLAVRAARLVVGRSWLAVAAGLVYVLSPPAIAALLAGRLSALVVLAALPGLALSYHRLLTRPVGEPAAWRSGVVAALLAAGAIAFEPVAAVGLTLFTVAALGGVSAAQALPRARLAARLLLVWVGAMAVLVPWSLELLRGNGPVEAPALSTPSVLAPAWRWLTLAPNGGLLTIAGIGLLAGGVLGLALGYRRRPILVGLLWATALAGMLVGRGLGAQANAPAWFGMALIVSAAALATLLALAGRYGGRTLTAHEFGWRQAATGVAAAALVAGAVTAAVTIARDGWSAFAVGDPAVPEFLTSEVAEVGPFRVLVLGDLAGDVRWDLTGARGPTMASYGLDPDAALLDEIGQVLRDVTEGDPAAADRLGPLNVRYLLVPPSGVSERLEEVLEAQLGLEPEPVAGGAIYRVRGWLPRVAWLPAESTPELSQTGETPEAVDYVAFARDGERYVGSAPRRGAVVVATPSDIGWTATADGRRLTESELAGLVRFELDEPARRVVVAPSSSIARRFTLAGQGLLVLLVVSLAVRPPMRRRGDPSDDVGVERGERGEPVLSGRP